MLASISRVSSWTMLSRILGFIRDWSLAVLFGSQSGLDAFLLAFSLPNTLRRIFAEGSFSQAFIPVLCETQTQANNDAEKKLINQMGSYLLLSLLITVLVLMLVSPVLLKIVAPGFAMHGRRYHIAQHCLLWMLPFLLCISMATFFHALLQSKHRYTLPAGSPVILNLFFLLGAWLFHKEIQPFYGLAAFVSFAGLLQWFLAWFFAKKHGFDWHFRLHALSKQSKAVIKLIGQSLFASAIGPIIVWVDFCLASFLPQGSITWLYLSQRLVYLPLGSFAVAISTVSLPYLSKLSHVSQKGLFFKTARFTLLCNLLLALPASLALYLLAKPMIITLFAKGQFIDTDVLKTCLSLKALCLGLPAFMLNKSLVSIYVSQQNIKPTVKAAWISLLVNVLLSLVLMWPMGHVGLALSSSVAAWVQCGLLLCWQKALLDWTQTEKKHLKHICLGSGVMAFVLSMLSSTQLPAWSFETSHAGLHASLSLLVLIFIGLFVYTAWMYRSAVLKYCYQTNKELSSTLKA
jgi:putative peptidoglycan lipid II flippase